jgi:hypothetical protein
MKTERYHVADLAFEFYTTSEEMLTLLRALGFCPDQSDTVSEAGLAAVRLIDTLSRALVQSSSSSKPK